MSGKPEDIPEDVWAKAGGLVGEFVSWSDVRFDEQAAEYVLTQTIARAILSAKSEQREADANLIEVGFDRVVGKRWRADGKPSKLDLCVHGRSVREDCDQCCAAAIRAVGAWTGGA